MEKLNSHEKKRLIIGVVLMIVLPVVIGMLLNASRNLYEGRLTNQLRENKDFRPFVESIDRDHADLAANPDHYKEVAATMDLGLQWYSMRKFTYAIKWWSRGLKIEPNNDVGWLNLGNGYAAINEHLNAEKAYRKAMELAGEGEIEACIAMGDLYKYQFAAKRDLEDDVYLGCMKKHGEKNRDLVAHLAGYYRDAKNPQKALEYFNILFNMEPTNEVVAEIKAMETLLKEQGKIPQ